MSGGKGSVEGERVGREESSKPNQSILSICSVLSTPSLPVAAAARRLLERALRERGDRVIEAAGGKAMTVTLDVAPGGPREGFSIADTPEGGVRIVGDDPRGLVYGEGVRL